MLFFVDGKLCDGGVAQRTDKHWAAGWGLLPPGLGLIQGTKDVRNNQSAWIGVGGEACPVIDVHVCVFVWCSGGI